MKTLKHIFLTLIAVFLLSSCSTDNDDEPIIQAHKFEFNTGELEGWVSVGLNTTIYFEDGSNTEISSSFDYNEHYVSVIIPENATSFELQFYIEDSSPAHLKFYGIDDNEIIIEDDIEQQVYEYEYTF